MKTAPGSRAESVVSLKSQTTNKTLLSFSILSLEKYCCKKLLEIEYLTPLTPEDYGLLKQIINLGKKYEYLSDVHFITYDDVLDLIQRLTVNTENVMLPNAIKEMIENPFEYVSYFLKQNHVVPIDILAYMTKIKIIESMYIAYSSEVTSMLKRQKLHEELTKLIQDTDTSKNKKGKDKGKGKKDSKKGKKSKSSKDRSSKRSKSSKDKKTNKSKKKTGPSSSTTVVKEKSTVEVIKDYTEITLQENDVIFDYNVDNHVQYIVLCGFPDIHIFEELSKQNVIISSIIELSLELSDLKNLDYFILELQDLFENPKKGKFLENTVLMNYKTSGEDSLKENLEGLLYVVKKINYIKRQHLCYIKNLKLFTYESVPKQMDLDCLVKYNKIMNSYPAELVNIPLIIDALIEEICWRELGPIYSLSDLSSEAGTDTFQENKEANEKIPYQVHEEDMLNNGYHSYNEIGYKYYNKSLEYLKFLKPLEEIEDISPVVQTRNRSVTTEEYCYCSNVKDLIDYFHLGIFCQMKRVPFEPKLPKEYYFTSNLVTYNESTAYQQVLPRKIGTTPLVPVIKEYNDVIINYHLKEDLSTSVLRQLIFKALLQYSCWDRLYCEESDAILLRFHDNLDEFGIETKMWNESLPTPVCLRDFCRYISIEKRKWLEEHKLTPHSELNKDEIEEECEGLKDMHVPELYQEYQYLLERPLGVPTEEKKQIFNKALEELLNYPTSDILTSYCARFDDVSSCNAYDLGSRRVQITGHTTIFHSDDGVKVTVDTCRFLNEDKKCSLNISADDNTLVFHTTDPSAFHFLLKDETLIRFSKLEKVVEVVQNTIEENGEAETQENKLIEAQEERELVIPKYDDYMMEVLHKHKLPTILPGILDKINIKDKQIDLTNEHLNFLLEMFKTGTHMRHSIYKISTKPSIRYLKRKTSPTILPLVGVLKRVLFKPVRRKKKIRGYNVVLSTKPRQKVPLMYDFHINFPHGLSISTLSRNRDLIEVKQSYKYSKRNEEYRIFYTSGAILIKNADGTTTIFRSNGDIITLTDDSESCSVNCPKNMTQIFKKQEEEICPFKLSRCEFPIVRDDTDFIALYEFGDIPFKRKTLLEFEGKKYTAFEGKVTETQAYYVLNENDYHSEETYFEREDGLRCIVDRKGKKVIEFPDGTKITAWPETEKDLIHVSQNPKIDGWVSVVVNYKFEHPNYISIVYDAFGRSTQLFLKDAVIKSKMDSFMVTTDKNIAIEVTTKNIVFLKTCALCDGDCICKIDLSKDRNGKLLEVFDSYDKYLVCDREGNCEINTNYIKGARNKNDCDHRWRHEDKKMFIINKQGPPGTLLWKNGIIENKMEMCHNMKNVKILNYMNKLTRKQTMEFFTEIHQNFTGRFTMTQCYQNKICLSKYKYLKGRDKLFYVTFRILSEFQKLQNDKEISQELTEFLETNLERISPYLLEGIKEIVNHISSTSQVEEERCSYRTTMQSTEQDSAQSVSSKSMDLNKVTIQEIIAKWRIACSDYRYLIKNKIFPPYFHSEYYRYIMSTLKTT